MPRRRNDDVRRKEVLDLRDLVSELQDALAFQYAEAQRLRRGVALSVALHSEAVAQVELLTQEVDRLRRLLLSHARN